MSDQQFAAQSKAGFIVNNWEAHKILAVFGTDRFINGSPLENMALNLAF